MLTTNKDLDEIKEPLLIGILKKINPYFNGKTAFDIFIL
jgi:hypothetical protein